MAVTVSQQTWQSIQSQVTSLESLVEHYTTARDSAENSRLDTERQLADMTAVLAELVIESPG